jgi:diamine N-acetyltransferase
MVGFVMYEIDCGVGSILRLMIDRAHQRQGYGRAALLEVVRRLRLEPEVEMVATSHRHDNAVVAALLRSVGSVPWELEGFAPSLARSTCDCPIEIEIAGQSAADTER